MSLRGFRMALVLVAALLGSLLVAPAASATTLQSTVLAPIGGKVTSAPTEPHHRPYAGNYSFDVATGSGAVYARFRNTNGALALSVASIGRACRSGVFADGGDKIVLNVVINGAKVGTVTYAHLTAFPYGVGAGVPVGARIGNIVNSTHGVTGGSTQSCWTGPHVHVEPRNDLKYGCYFGGLLNTTVASNSALGIVGGERAAGVNTVCPAGAETPSNPLDQYVGKIVKWRNADGSQTSWLVYGDRTRRWMPNTTVYNCLVGHGAVDKGAQSSTTLDQLPDRSGSQATCSPPSRPTTRGVVSSGQGLDRGVTVSSGTGFYRLVQQGDGNLALYKSGGRPIWANGANGPTAWTIMQGDGNLVAYDVIGRARWASGTGGNGASRLVLQDDGNAVIYRNSDGRAVWQSRTGGGRHPVAQPAGRTDRLGVNKGIWRGGATLTSSDGRFRLVLQASDGNMVIYQGNTAIWAIGGRDDDFLVNQGDGNVVIYRTHGGAVWSTGTAGHGASTLVMQSDGNLVLYRGSDGRPIWSSRTGGR